MRLADVIAAARQLFSSPPKAEPRFQAAATPGAAAFHAGLASPVCDFATFDSQAARLSGVVTNAVARGERAVALHGRASRRIDAAIYELAELRRELSAVVDLRPLPR